MVDDQLNSGQFGKMTDVDWTLAYLHLEGKERLFGITIDRTLTIDDSEGSRRASTGR
jgi:hypothetical protein